MPSLIHLPHRSLIHLRGRDTFKYLQALTTNNLSRPSSQFTSFLNAQGRVLYDAFIYRTGESECYLETDSLNLEGLMAHLKRYKLRSKFEMRAVEQGELKVYSLFNLPETYSMPNTETMIHQPDLRALNFGHRILSSSIDTPLEALQAQESTIQRYTQARYLNGIPEGPDEILPEKALPMESNIDYMHGLDFHKGCYLGQELTVRTHHTGVIRKRIVTLRLFQSADSIPPPTLESHVQLDANEEKWVPRERCDVQLPGGNKGRAIGRILSSIGDLGLGLWRLDNLSQGKFLKDGVEMGVMPYRPAHWPS